MTAAPEAKAFHASPSRSAFCERKPADAKPAGSADNLLRRAVLGRLIAHPLVRAGHICVAATAGGVTLSGYVTSNAQRDAAITATRRVEGVDQVVDNLTVAVPCSEVADPGPEGLEVRPLFTAAQLIRTIRTAPVPEAGVVHLGLRP
jgi:hypothetical protein